MKDILIVIGASLASATLLTGFAYLYGSWAEKRKSRYHPVGKW